MLWKQKHCYSVKCNQIARNVYTMYNCFKSLPLPIISASYHEMFHFLLSVSKCTQVFQIFTVWKYGFVSPTCMCEEFCMEFNLLSFLRVWEQGRVSSSPHRGDSFLIPAHDTLKGPYPILINEHHRRSVGWADIRPQALCLANSTCHKQSFFQATLNAIRFEFQCSPRKSHYFLTPLMF